MTTTKASLSYQMQGNILLNRLNVHLDRTGLITESQCGFGKDRGTIYLHSKTASGEMPRTECRSIHDVSDLTNAFDIVSLDGLWKIMAVDCPPRFISVVWQCHDGTQARV